MRKPPGAGARRPESAEPETALGRLPRNIRGTGRERLTGRLRHTGYAPKVAVAPVLA